jgi:hypothetical protein
MGLVAPMGPEPLPVSWKWAMAISMGNLPGLLLSRTRFAEVHSTLSTVKPMKLLDCLVVSFPELVE